MPKLYLIRGLPGSGKSTYGERLARSLDTPYFFEADKFREGNDIQAIRAAHLQCLNATEMAMEEGQKDVVVANCFLAQADLESYRGLAKWFKYSVTEQVMVGRWKNTHGITDERIEQMARMWEP